MRALYLLEIYIELNDIEMKFIIIEIRIIYIRASHLDLGYFARFYYLIILYKLF